MEDDADIRALIGSVSMPGAVSIRFSREPDYFLGTTIMGNPCDVLVARHQLDGKLAGIAVRAEHRAFLNGQEATLGYIGQMRIAPDYRGRWLVHQGAEWFREASTPDLLYFGVISSENSRVRQLMTGSRPPAGLHTRDMGGLTTCALLLHPSRLHCAPGVDIFPGSVETLPEIVDFLQPAGRPPSIFSSLQPSKISPTGPVCAASNRRRHFGGAPPRPDRGRTFCLGSGVI